MQYLDQKLILPNILLHNRLVMPPMATSDCDENGQITRKLLDYYSEKTHGGYIGLVITEHAFVSPEGVAHPRQMSVSRDSDVPGLTLLAETLHKNGSKAVAQINHAGGAGKKEFTGLDSVAPSPEPIFNGRPADRILTVDDIHQLVQKFADAARRCVEAGFDGVEIHSAHRYLLNQFYSPIANKRTDEYGGGVLDRIRIHLEVIKAVWEAIGPEHVLLLRLGALDYLDGGNTIEDAVIAAKAFEQAGIDILDISGGMTGYTVKGRETWQGYFTPETERLKKEISIPVIMTGGVTDPAAAEEILAKGQADLIGVGRALLKDSGWAEKALG